MSSISLQTVSEKKENQAPNTCNFLAQTIAAPVVFLLLKVQPLSPSATEWQRSEQLHQCEGAVCTCTVLFFWFDT